MIWMPGEVPATTPRLRILRPERHTLYGVSEQPAFSGPMSSSGKRWLLGNALGGDRRYGIW